MVVYGEVETGTGDCEVVSPAEGFAGVDCCVSVFPTWVSSAGKRFSMSIYLQEKETFSSNMDVRFGGCSHSADLKCITR